MNLKWTNHSDNPCPSCIALDGQVHTEKEWETFGIEPKNIRLYCRTACSCTMTETDEETHGSLAGIPLRHYENTLQEDGSDGGSAASLSTGDTPEPPGRADMENTYTLQAKATATEEGFEILAINEGEAKGHGITFSRQVLMDAMPLYDNLPVFIDHSQSGGQSIRNLAGTLHNPTWNEREQGIQLQLRPDGPAKDVLLSVREAAKRNPAIMQAVGFSSVILCRVNSKNEVTKITRARSTDVVIEPARGGKFLSALENQNKENEMSEQNTEQAEIKLQAAAQQVKALQVQLLDQTLKASGLPEASQKAVKKSLSNVEDLTAEVIETAINEKREELSAASKPQPVQGPSRQQVTRVMDSADQFQLAVEDLFGLEREPEQKNARVHRLSGIREAYLLATGDQDFIGGYHREFALVTANFPGIIANVQNKILLKAWDQLRPVYGWWERIVTVEHFTNLNDISWVKTGTIASLPTVAERGEYTELPIGDNKETSSFEKFGGYVPLTLEAVLRDDLRAFRQMPKEIALAGMRNISEQVAEIFTTASAAGPTLADGGALFNATAVTTAGGHANLLTTALGTDFVAWDAIASAVYNQPLLVKNATGYYGTGKKMGIEPRYILVPRALKAQAEALFIPRLADVLQTAGIATKGQPSYGGGVEPIVVPEWTDATDYAAVVDPALVPGIMIGEIFGVKPQIFSAASEIDPAMFANDESRIKVRQFLAVGVADFRPLHKSNVAG